MPFVFSLLPQLNAQHHEQALVRGCILKTTELCWIWVCLLSTDLHPYSSLLPPPIGLQEFLYLFFPPLELSHCDNHNFSSCPSSWKQKRLHFPGFCGWWSHVISSGQWVEGRRVIWHSWMKAFKSQCVILHVLSPSIVKHLLKWKCHGSSYHTEGSFPRNLPRLRALQEQEINSRKTTEILVWLITAAQLGPLTNTSTKSCWTQASSHLILLIITTQK